MRVETPAEQLLFATVFIRALSDSGAGWTGTGFIYAVNTDKGDVFVLVTNRHVVTDAVSLTFRFIRERDGTPIFGEAVTGEWREGYTPGWSLHPKSEVDIAVLPIAPVLKAMATHEEPPFFRAVPGGLVPAVAQWMEFDALERVVFVGYPAGLYDSANLTPIARQGMTATPMTLDYQGLPAFVIDAGVYPGSSGSPVFIYDKGLYTDRRGNTTIGSRLFFVGVLAAVHTQGIDAPVTEAAGKLVASFEQVVGLGIVFRAQAVDECVDRVLAAAKLHRQPTASITPDPSAIANAANEALAEDSDEPK